MTTDQSPIKLRLDVDYAYPSRAKSFAFLALRVKNKRKNYMKNSKIIARMINESPKQVMAYWFFTPYTIPDKTLLDLLTPDRNEVGLHVVNDPYRELEALENATKRNVNYYYIHGTSRVIAQLLWGRKIGQKQTAIPTDFPLKSFHDYPTFSLDMGRRKADEDPMEPEILKIETQKLIQEGTVISVHPEWLFKSSIINPRRPYYEILKDILDVDHDLETLHIKKKFSGKIAHDVQEYEKNIIPSDGFLKKLSERDVDIFTFLERKWCCPIQNPPKAWIKTEDNVGMLEIKNYETWWSYVGKKTRNMVRRADKEGVKVNVVEPSEKLAEGIWKIYNETPIRQDRAFSHYGESFEAVVGNVTGSRKSTFIGAFLENELIGFIQLIYGEDIAVIAQILSLQKHWDKSVNNALLAKAVEVSAQSGVRWVMYGRIGNHPSLDRFKESNGFAKFPISRYYVPLNGKGRIAIRLGLYRDLKDALPESVKYPLIPLMNWVSRSKVKLRLRLAGRGET